MPDIAVWSHFRFFMSVVFFTFQKQKTSPRLLQLSCCEAPETYPYLFAHAFSQ